MDPLSIAVSCFTLIEIVSKASRHIHNFVRDFSDAKDDLEAINRELLELGRVLNILRNGVKDSNDSSDATRELERIVLPIIDECTAAAIAIEKVLDDYEREGNLGKFKWSAYAKRQVRSLQAKLERRRAKLNDIVVTMSYMMTQSIKADTTAIIDKVDRLAEGVFGIVPGPASAKGHSLPYTRPLMLQAKDDLEVDSAMATVNQGRSSYVPPRVHRRRQIRDTEVEATFAQRREPRRAMRTDSQVHLEMENTEQPGHPSRMASLELPRRYDSESPSPYRNRRLSTVPKAGEWEFILPWASTQRESSNTTPTTTAQKGASQVIQEALDTARISLALGSGLDQSSKKRYSGSRLGVKLASYFELESRPDCGIISVDKSMAAVLEKDIVSFVDIQSVKGEIIGCLDLESRSSRSRGYRDRVSQDGQQSGERLRRIMRFLTTDGSLFFVEHSDGRKEMFHTATQRLVKRWVFDRGITSDFVALDENHGMIVVCEEPTIHGGPVDLNLIEVSNLSSDPETPNVTFKEQVIYRGMDYDTSFRFLHGGRSVILVPRSYTPESPFHCPIVLNLRASEVSQVQLTLQLPDWARGGEEFSVQSYAGFGDTLAMSVGTNKGKLYAVSWYFNSGALRCCQELTGTDCGFVTKNCRFIWTGVDRDKQQWRGTISELSTMKAVDPLWYGRNFYSQEGCTLMSRGSYESEIGPQRVEIHNIVGDDSGLGYY